MICIEKQCFSLNKILLLTVGLWPYQRTKLIQFQFIFFLSILTTAILFQLTAFLTFEPTSNLIINILSTASFFTTFVIKYTFFGWNFEAIKYLLAQLQQTYSDLRDKYEITIVEKYTYNAKWYTVTLSLFGLSTIPLIVMKVWSSYFFNVSLSKNVSKSHYLFITMEYFIDQEKYFYAIVWHIYGALFIGLATLIATGSMLVAYLQHTCGMFMISSYRIKRMMEFITSQSIILENEKCIKTKKIMCAVEMHRQAIKLSKLLVTKYEIMLFCLIVMGVISLSLNFFQISRLESNIDKYFIPTIFVLTSVIYMFVSNYTGQEVMDHNKQVFFTAYSVRWYLAPLHLQKIVLFLLQKGQKDLNLSVGGLFVGSLECFATLIKASVSYFTVMNSIH